jgi:hypothetical protein
VPLGSLTGRDRPDCRDDLVVWSSLPRKRKSEKRKNSWISMRTW